MNRLAQSSSPYLRQHAHNPVDWYPWGPEALARAAAEQKPILLSIGYSACHWCHVMAHESFEDPATAAQMNADFINIKVDREERPDLDHIYQSAHGLLTGRPGGWPLTVLLTPAQEPFFTGTYFPPTARHRLPAFRDVLTRISEAWQAQRADIARQNTDLLAALAADAAPAASPHDGWTPAQDADLPDAARLALLRSHDPINGGFGDAPKFPHPGDLELMLVGAARGGDQRLLEAVERSLRGMGDRGLFDQLGGGFFRYCVDGAWDIPHFEKMLYDNGPLLRLCADLWCLTHAPRLKELAEATVGWLLREMRSPDGTFYAALDADSDGHEGRFYVWQRDEARAIVGEAAWPAVARCFGFDSTPNFEHQAWHLHWHGGAADAAAQFLQGSADTMERAAGAAGAAAAEAPLTATALEQARAKLLAARAARVRPGLDDKVLVAWNGLMIRGLARAGQVFGRSDWVDAALDALRTLQRQQFLDGRLQAVQAGGRAQFNAYLDDHAFLLDASLECLQARWDGGVLALACQLADAILERFEDRASGGFEFTSHDHEALITRPRILTDAAVPAGYAVATRTLFELGELIGEPRYQRAAERALAVATGPMRRRPAAFGSLMLALECVAYPARTVILRGPATQLAAWQQALAAEYLPDARIYAVPEDASDLPALLAKPILPGQVNAWVCQGVECLPEIASLDELKVVCKTLVPNP